MMQPARIPEVKCPICGKLIPLINGKKPSRCPKCGGFLGV